jgi:hypothetical protein
VSSALRKSATVDEQSHLFRGVAYLKTGAPLFRWGREWAGPVAQGDVHKQNFAAIPPKLSSPTR